jgi:chloride channel protein, CIC family
MTDPSPRRRRAFGMAIVPGRLPNLNDLTSFARVFEFRAVSRWVGLGLVVGVVSGLGAAAFFVSMDWLRHMVFAVFANSPTLEPRGEHSLFAGHGVGNVRRWVLLIAPALGGLASGILVSRFCPEAEGHGTDALIEAFHRKRGVIRGRVPIIKSLASVALIGTGGSAGREGPIAQIGAGFASIFAKALRLSDRDRRLLVMAGAAGGIGAIFRSPLGGALFVVEVLYRDDFEVDALVPALLSSVVAYSVFTMLFGSGAIFATEAHYSFDPRQLPFYLVLAMGAALVGWVYIKIFYGMQRKVFAPLKLPSFIKPAIGGLCLGLIGMFVPEAFGAGYGFLQEAIVPKANVLPLGWIGAGTLLGLALLKVLATSLSVSSGGSGGVFGPSVVIGGMLGGAFGLAFHEIAPSIVPQPGAFVIVGMACFFGGVAHVPVSSLVMASEMTGSYDLLVPIMLAEVVVLVMLRRWTLYEKQVATRRDSPAHGPEYVLDVLQHIRVSDVLDGHREVVSVDPARPLDELLRDVCNATQTVFPVVEGDGRVLGVVTLDSLKNFFLETDLGRIAIAADCTEPLVGLSPGDTLATALERFASSHYPELPVLDGGSPPRVVGTITYEELLRAYNRDLVHRRSISGDSAAVVS